MARIEWGVEQRHQPEVLPIASFKAQKQFHHLHDEFANGRPTRVFVSEHALADLHAHLGSDLDRENGGLLMGLPFLDPETGALYVDIRFSVPAEHAKGTSAHLQFTPEAWQHMSTQIEQEFNDLVAVGWYHSHPGLGVFLSSTDRATQRAFFSNPWSIALVVDPVARTQGWFLGPQGEQTQAVTSYRERPVDGPPPKVMTKPVRHPMRAAWAGLLLSAALVVLLLEIFKKRQNE